MSNFLKTYAFCFMLLLFGFGGLVPLQAQDLNWSLQGLSDGAELPANANYSYNGANVTVSWSVHDDNGTMNPMSGYDFVEYDSGSVGGETGNIMVGFDNGENNIGDYVEVAFDFAETQYGFQFSMMDIDQYNQRNADFQDTVKVFFTTEDGTEYNLRDNADWWTIPSTFPTVHTYGSDAFTGNGGSDDTQDYGNLDCNVSGLPVKSVRFQFYCASEAGNDPTQEKICFSNLRVVEPELSASMSVIDQDGGLALPGDTLEYTIRVQEVAGNGASATVTDSLPSALINVGTPRFYLQDGTEIYPASYTPTFTYSYTAATGELKVDDLFVPGNQSVDIVFEADLADELEAGTLVRNDVSVSERFGAVKEAFASIIVGAEDQPQPPVSGNKQLYLHADDDLLSRQQPSSLATLVQISHGGSHTWTLNPAIAASTTFEAGEMTVQLLLGASGYLYYRDIDLILLKNDIEVASLMDIELRTSDLRDAAPLLQTFSIPLNSDIDLVPGDSLKLRIQNNYPNNSNRLLDVYQYSGGDFSFISPSVETVINVDAVEIFSGAYPSTEQASSIKAGDTVYVRSTVSDPFGYEDINRADLQIRPPSGTSVSHAFSLNEYVYQTASTKTFEYAYTLAVDAVAGTYGVSLKAYEGVENTIDHTGATVFEVESGPDLSTSTKTVQDLNGGDVQPGDELEYTITLIESAGVAVSGVQVTDVLPLGLQSFSIESIPVGATDESVAGSMDIRNISLSANGSAEIILRAPVADTVAAGTTIDNTATLTYGSESYTTPAASVVVQQSDPPIEGNKYLYIYTEPSSPRKLSRTPPTSQGNDKQVFRDSSVDFPLSPGFALPTTFSAGNMRASLLMTRNAEASSGHQIEIELLGSDGESLGTSGTVDINGLSSTVPSRFEFSIVVDADISFVAGDGLTLRIYDRSGDKNHRFYVYQLSSGEYSYISPLVSPVIFVDSLTFHDAPFSAGGGTEISAASPGETVYARAVVSDPFGAFDISSAVISAADASGTALWSEVPLSEVASDDATKTFEYELSIPADAAAGYWNTSVTAHEGTEGTISHTRTVALEVLSALPDLIIVKHSDVLRDPVNDTVNPKRIPGAEIRYTLLVQNSGSGSGDADSIVISDFIPENTVMMVSGTPIVFDADSSGLTYSFMGLDSDADDLIFQNTAGDSIVPSADAEGTDANVKRIEINPKGLFNPHSQFNLTFKVLLQ